MTDNFKDKEKILKVSSGKEQITYKGIRIRLHLVFISKNLTSKGQYSNVFKVSEGKNVESTYNLYATKL